MIPFVPKQIATRAVMLYAIALALVSIVFMDHALSMTFIVLNMVWVLLFFVLGANCSRRWIRLPKKTFVTRLFWVAFGLRLVWVFFSYFFYMERTGSPFEFSAGDSIWYYEESLGNLNAPLIDVWKYLFVNTDTVSDSGYVMFLSILGKVTGASILLPRMVNAAISAYTCVLVYQLTQRTVGERVGRLASVFTCFMPNLIYYCGLHLKESVMLFLLVACLDRSDALMKSKKIEVWNLLLVVLLMLSLFTFRTALGVAAAFSLVTALVFSSTSVVGRRRRVMLVAWGGLAAFTFFGGVIMNEVEGLWEDRGTNQENKRSLQTLRGNQWAKYANGAVMAPMMFVMPFPTMVDVDEQYNQQMVSGGNYVRNFLGGFVLIAVFSALFVKKNWRDLTLIAAFAISYLGIVSASGFANSERFLLPGLPCLLILAAYGLSLLNAKYYRYLKIWYGIVPLMIIGWAVFKLGSRGLL